MVSGFSYFFREISQVKIGKPPDIVGLKTLMDLDPIGLMEGL